MVEWKFIPGCEGNYKVSSDGKIYSIPRRGTPGKMMKLHKDKWGYLYTGIRVNGQYKSIFVHRAVALAFIPNAEMKPEVNHINGIKTDNRAENLEWVTSSENTIHAYSIGLMKQKKKGSSNGKEDSRYKKDDSR